MNTTVYFIRNSEAFIRPLLINFTTLDNLYTFQSIYLSPYCRFIGVCYCVKLYTKGFSRWFKINIGWFTSKTSYINFHCQLVGTSFRIYLWLGCRYYWFLFTSLRSSFDTWDPVSKSGCEILLNILYIFTTDNHQ